MAYLSKQQVQAGEEAEKEARWQIERAYGSSKNWGVLHNLILPDPRSDSPCQIDHLIIGRCLDFIVIETKSTKNGVLLHKENGTWNCIYKGKPQLMRSPIEQNKRHIECLDAYIKNNDILPKRLGIPLLAKFHNWILIQPGARLPKTFDGAHLIPRDALSSHAKEFIDKGSLLDILKVVSTETLEQITGHLAFLQQKPKPPKEEERQNPAEETEQAPSDKKEQNCQRCHTPIDNGVAFFCRVNKRRFGGKLLCRTCQPLETQELTCDECNTPVDQKIEAFCKFNAKKFGGRLLCRTCQKG